MVIILILMVILVICFGVWVKWCVVVVGMISKDVIMSVLINFIDKLIVSVVISISNIWMCFKLILFIWVSFGLIVIDSNVCYC